MKNLGQLATYSEKSKSDNPEVIELKNAIKKALDNKQTIIWNDPDPIEGNNYIVKNIIFDYDTALIQYGEGSKAEVYLSELEIQIVPEDMQIVFFNGYDEIRDVKTNDVLFKTNGKDEELSENVCDDIVNIWNHYSYPNQFGSRGILDYYLLYAKCTQDAREVVIEKLHAYYKDKWLKIIEVK